jgi:hypothetical protein
MLPRMMYYIVVPIETEKGEINGYVVLDDGKYIVSDKKENLAVFTKENAGALIRDYGFEGRLVRF